MGIRVLKSCLSCVLNFPNSTPHPTVAIVIGTTPCYSYMATSLKTTPSSMGYSWWLEVLSLAGSISLLVSLAAILSSMDGKPIFHFYSVTLNTVVALLSMASKAMMVFVVASCIGQWKWALFSESPRRLLDFERIEAASRGPLGSLNLLFNFKVKGG